MGSINQWIFIHSFYTSIEPVNATDSPSVTAAPCHLPLHRGGFLKQQVHELYAVVYKDALLAVFLGLAQGAVFHGGAVIDQEGHGVAVVGAGGHEGLVVAEEQEAEVHVLLL